MHDIVAIAGSPSSSSRSSAVLEYANHILINQGLKVESITVRSIPPEDLVFGNFESPALKEVSQLIENAKGIVIATPVYKASYTGVLKAMLDLLSQYAFAGKTILPIATGGTITHLLSIDYAMKPLFSTLGATNILRGVFIVDSQMQRTDEGGIVLDDDVDLRLKESLIELSSILQQTRLAVG
ncbi:MAG: NADPH-dependent FMN reductase [Elainellaceae cyanobacterium]